MLTVILQLIENIFPELQELSVKDKRLIYDEVSFALKQTKAHINATRRNRSDTASTTLSNIWQRASRNIAQINHPVVKQLADTIEQKSRYWSDPDGYETGHFKKYSMRIVQVEETLNKICT